MSDTTGWWEQAPIVDVQPNRRVWFRRFLRAVGLAAGLARIWWPVLPVAVFLAVWGPLGALLEAVVMAAVVVVSPTLRDRLRSAPMRCNPSSVHKMAAAAPSESGAHIGSVSG